jgi:uncharacterized protein (DUF58 family)
MSGRSGAALAVGATALLGAWLFGSVALAPVGIGIVAAALSARAWRRAVSSSLRLERSTSASRLVEGETLRVELRLAGRLSRFARVVAREHVGQLGAIEVPLVRGRGELTWVGIPRGLHELGPAEVVLEDPLGLERISIGAPSFGRVIVHPRTVELRALFTDGGRSGFGGRRPALRRQSGVDLHSVRDYQHGEPLRLVHWPTTARRGSLSVRELEDTPREGTVVVLDCDPTGVAGPQGHSSFDEAVRATASIVRARAALGRVVTLVVASSADPVLRVRGLDASYAAALDGLAAAVPAGPALAATLSDPRLGAARAAELVVVTCNPHATALGRLQEARAGAVVAIDGPTYAGAAPSAAFSGLLRLAAGGVPVAVLRAGDDLAAALAGLSKGQRSA